MSEHVAIIGAGIAGFAAAIGARRGGAKHVTIYSSHAGATRFAGGAWDVAPADDSLAPRLTVAEWVSRFSKTHPSHPYARFSGDVLAALKISHDEVFRALGIYRAIDWDGHGVAIHTDLGLERRAATAQESILQKGEMVESIARAQGQALFDAMTAALAQENIEQRFGDVTDLRYDIVLGATDLRAVVIATGKFLGGTLRFTKGRVSSQMSPLTPFVDQAPFGGPSTADGHDPLVLFGNDILGDAPGHRRGSPELWRREADCRPTTSAKGPRR